MAKFVFCIFGRNYVMRAHGNRIAIIQPISRVAVIFILEYIIVTNFRTPALSFNLANYSLPHSRASKPITKPRDFID